MKLARNLAALLLTATAWLCAAAEPEYAVVDGDALRSYWVAAGKHSGPSYPRSLFVKGIESCVALGFSIDADGKTENITVLRTVTNKPNEKDAIAKFHAAAVQAAAQWRYEPAAENAARKPVYTYVTLSESFSPTNVTKEAAMKHAHEVDDACRIADFAAAVARGDFVQKRNPSP
ncbi:MAG TPA: TonB family protein [Rudaea sp.]